ncbi:MAG: sigma-54-dependent transcriptional regulator [Bacteroidota bacterium]
MKNQQGTARILIVDDEEKIRNILAAVLKDEGYDVQTARDGVDAVAKSTVYKPDLLIVDLQMPQLNGMETIRLIKEQLPDAISIILTAHGTIQSAVQAIKEGVYDYLTKPFDNEQVLLVVRRAVEIHRLKTEVNQLKSELRGRYGIHSLIGESEVMKTVRRKILELASTDATVLIEGESGAGKELAARAIHYESKRMGNPFVIVDCAAVPPNLIESEFFGHERGAFTDARSLRIGKFEEANGGTIFLDEISELPLEAQAKLLRVLQEREFTRVGGNQLVRVDVRVIAATNKDLEVQVANGKFREDLYYRLNVLKLRMPPLREHVADIPVYARHFLAKFSPVLGKNITEVSDEALALLKSREWKGNIRELENVVQRAMLNARGNRIEESDIEQTERSGRISIAELHNVGNLQERVQSIAEQIERQIILEALNEVNWNRTKAAEKLGISRKTLFNKMRQYGIGK